MEVRMTRLPLALVLLLLPFASASAQSVTDAPPVAKIVDLSGPRFGITALSPGVVDKLHERGIEVGSTISQFGWQFERQFFQRGASVAAVNEWIVLLGGMDQDVVIPSLTWMVGLRTREGVEFGVGPNITPAGVSMAIAAGVTMRAGPLNVPMNVAIVPGKAGTRVSILTGFNTRRR
jgi:hypothetical protein